MRRRPVLSFLPRRHPVNRLLGRFIRVWAVIDEEAAPEPQSA
jgi:hypothetical protein